MSISTRLLAGLTSLGGMGVVAWLTGGMGIASSLMEHVFGTLSMNKGEPTVTTNVDGTMDLMSMFQTLTERIAHLESGHVTGMVEPVSSEQLSKEELIRLTQYRMDRGLPYQDLINITLSPEPVDPAALALYRSELGAEAKIRAKAAKKARKAAKKAAKRIEAQAQVQAYLKPSDGTPAPAPVVVVNTEPERGNGRPIHPSNNIVAKRNGDALSITVGLGGNVAWALGRGTYSDRGKKVDWSAKTFASTWQGRARWLDLGNGYQLSLRVRKDFGTSSEYDAGSKPTEAAPDQNA